MCALVLVSTHGLLANVFITFTSHNLLWTLPHLEEHAGSGPCKLLISEEENKQDFRWAEKGLKESKIGHHDK